MQTLKLEVFIREAMGTAARELLLSRFSADRAMASWVALLRRHQPAGSGSG
jgi:hypothetical protein